MNLSIKNFVKNNNTVHFTFYRDGNLYYEVTDWDNEISMEFPVPISDIGNATFKATDKAMLFMRYIRKHLEMLNEAKAARVVEDPTLLTGPFGEYYAESYKLVDEL